MKPNFSSKRIYCTFACIALFVMTGCGGAGSRSHPSNGSQPTLGQTQQNATTAQGWIGDIQPMLVLNSDGTISLADGRGRAVALEGDELAFADGAVSEVNQLVRAGDVVVNADFSLTPTAQMMRKASATTRSVAGSFGWTPYWWGYAIWMDATAADAVSSAIDAADNPDAITPALLGFGVPGDIAEIFALSIFFLGQLIGVENSLGGNGVVIYSLWYDPTITWIEPR